MFTAVYGVGYTVVSFVLVAAASGMAERSSIPFSLMGSPFNVVSDIGLLFPLPGLILGVLLIRGHGRAAAGWLLIHYVGIPIAIWHNSYLSVRYQLDQLHLTPEGTLALAIFYLLGNVFAWVLIFRRDSSMVPNEV